MTLDLYLHPWPSSDKRSRAAIHTFLSGQTDFLRTANTSPQARGQLADYLDKA